MCFLTFYACTEYGNLLRKCKTILGDNIADSPIIMYITICVKGMNICIKTLSTKHPNIQPLNMMEKSEAITFGILSE